MHMGVEKSKPYASNHRENQHGYGSTLYSSNAIHSPDADCWRETVLMDTKTIYVVASNSCPASTKTVITRKFENISRSSSEQNIIWKKQQ